MNCKRLPELTLRVINCSKLHEIPYGREIVAMQFMEQSENLWHSQFMMLQHQFINKRKE